MERTSNNRFSHGATRSGYRTTSVWCRCGSWYVEGWWGLPYLRIEVCRIYKISISCFWSIWNSHPRFLRILSNNLYHFPVPAFTTFGKQHQAFPTQMITCSNFQFPIPRMSQLPNLKCFNFHISIFKNFKIQTVWYVDLPFFKMLDSQIWKYYFSRMPPVFSCVF